MTQQWIIALVILVLIIGAGWYFIAQNQEGDSTGTDTTTEAVDNGNTSEAGSAATLSGSGSGNVQTLFTTRSGNYTCSFTVMNPASPGNSFNGTLFATGSNTRADFETKTNQGVVTSSHMIRTGGYSYTWVDGSVLGIKAAVGGTAQTQTTAGGYIDPNGTANWDCHPWVPETSKFSLPKGITFQ